MEKKQLVEKGEKTRFNLEQTLKKTIREADAYKKENENLKEKNRELDRKANPHRYRLSSGLHLLTFTFLQDMYHRQAFTFGHK